MTNKLKLDPGPWHIHWPDDGGRPSNYDCEAWPPTFLLEFGKPGEDYGGCLVSGWASSPQVDDDGNVINTWALKQSASVIQAAPKLLAACKDIRFAVLLTLKGHSLQETIERAERQIKYLKDIAGAALAEVEIA